MFQVPLGSGEPKAIEPGTSAVKVDDQVLTCVAVEPSA